MCSKSTDSECLQNCGSSLLRSNSWTSVGGKRPFDPNILTFFYVLSILHLYSLFTFSSVFFPDFSFWHFPFWATRPPDLGLLAPTYKQEQDHQDMEAIFLLTLLPFTHGGCETATVGLTTTRYNTSVQSAFLAIHLGNSACGLVFSDDTVDFL